MNSNKPDVRALPKIPKKKRDADVPVQEIFDDDKCASSSTEIPAGFQVSRATIEERQSVFDLINKKQRNDKLCSEDSWRNVQAHNVDMIRNRILENNFEAYKEQRNIKEETIGYRVVYENDEIAEIAEKGLRASTDAIGDIGMPQKGVMMYSSPALAYGGRFLFSNIDVRVMVFRTVVSGKQHSVPLSSGSVEPSKKHHYHVLMKTGECEKFHTLTVEHLSAATYHYEYTDDFFDLKRYPSMILPHAIVTYKLCQLVQPSLQTIFSKIHRLFTAFKTESTACTHTIVTAKEIFTGIVHLPPIMHMVPHILTDTEVTPEVVRIRNFENFPKLAVLRRAEYFGKLLQKESVHIHGMGTYAYFLLEFTHYSVKFIDRLRRRNSMLFWKNSLWTIFYLPTGAVATEFGFPHLIDFLHVIICRNEIEDGPRCILTGNEEPHDLAPLWNAADENMKIAVQPEVFKEEIFGDYEFLTAPGEDMTNSPSFSPSPMHVSSGAPVTGILRTLGTIATDKKVRFKDDANIAEIRYFDGVRTLNQGMSFAEMQKNEHIKENETKNKRLKEEQNERCASGTDDLFKNACARSSVDRGSTDSVSTPVYHETDSSRPSSANSGSSYSPPEPIIQRTGPKPSVSTAPHVAQSSIPKDFSRPPPKVPTAVEFTSSVPPTIPQGIPVPQRIQHIPQGVPPPSAIPTGVPPPQTLPTGVPPPQALPTGKPPPQHALPTRVQPNFSVPPPPTVSLPNMSIPPPNVFHPINNATQIVPMNLPPIGVVIPPQLASRSAPGPSAIPKQPDLSTPSPVPHSIVSSPLATDVNSLPLPGVEKGEEDMDLEEDELKSSEETVQAEDNDVLEYCTTQTPKDKKKSDEKSPNPFQKKSAGEAVAIMKAQEGPVNAGIQDTDYRQTKDQAPVNFSIMKKTPPTKSLVNVLKDNEEDEQSDADNKSVGPLHDSDFRRSASSSSRRRESFPNDRDDRKKHKDDGIDGIPLPKQSAESEATKKLEQSIQGKLRATAKERKKNPDVVDSGLPPQSWTKQVNVPLAIPVDSNININETNFVTLFPNLAKYGSSALDSLGVRSSISANQSSSSTAPAIPSASKDYTACSIFSSDPPLKSSSIESRKEYPCTSTQKQSLTGNNSKKPVDLDHVEPSTSDRKTRESWNKSVLEKSQKKDAPIECIDLVSSDDEDDKLPIAKNGSFESGPSVITLSDGEDTPPGITTRRGLEGRSGNAQGDTNLTLRSGLGALYSNGDQNNTGIIIPQQKSAWMNTLSSISDRSADNYTILVDPMLLKSRLDSKEMAILFEHLYRLKQSVPPASPRIHATIFLHSSLYTSIKTVNQNSELFKFVPIFNEYIERKPSLVEVLPQHSPCDLITTPLPTLATCLSNLHRTRQSKEVVFLTDQYHEESPEVQCMVENDIKVMNIHRLVQCIEARIGEPLNVR